MALLTVLVRHTLNTSNQLIKKGSRKNEKMTDTYFTDGRNSFDCRNIFSWNINESHFCFVEKLESDVFKNKMRKKNFIDPQTKKSLSIDKFSGKCWRK